MDTKLKFADILIPSFNIFLGTMGKGKSSAMRGICTEKFLNGDIDFVIVFCHIQYYDVYKQWVPEDYIYTEFSHTVIQNLNDLLTEVKGKFRGCIIFDDIAEYAGAFSSDNLKSFFSQIKNSDLLVMISLHYIYGTKVPLLINLSNYVWIFEANDENSFKGCYNAFGRRVSRKIFKQYIDKYAFNPKSTSHLYRNVLFIDKTDPENEFSHIQLGPSPIIPLQFGYKI